jgi:hypothetical protein
MPTLNVILHGLIALVRQKDSIIALMPDVKQHVFRAGSWLGEIELRNGFYSLTGVNSGTADFDKTKNLILENAQMSPDGPSAAYATILFPKPKEIHSLRPVAIDPKTDLSGRDAAGITATALTSIQIFVYDCPDLSQFALQGHPFLPPQDPKLAVFNLHVYSEEDVDPADLDHAVNAFDEAVALFKNLDLKLVNSKPIPPADPTEPRPDGVVLMELEDLGYRQSRLTNHGEILRGILSSPNPDFSLLAAAWGDQQPRAGELSNCSFPIGGGGNGG